MIELLYGTREAGDRIAHVDDPYPGGESWRAAVERNQRVLPDLRAIWDGCRVLLIGHAATRFVAPLPVTRIVSRPASSPGTPS